jgi:hypothetical protein
VELPVEALRTGDVRIEAAEAEAELGPREAGGAERRGQEERKVPDPHDRR